MKTPKLIAGAFAVIVDEWKAWTECDLAGDGACFGTIRDIPRGIRGVIHRLSDEPRRPDARALLSVSHDGRQLWTWMDSDRIAPEATQPDLFA